MEQKLFAVVDYFDDDEVFFCPVCSDKMYLFSEGKKTVLTCQSCLRSFNPDPPYEEVVNGLQTTE